MLEPKKPGAGSDARSGDKSKDKGQSQDKSGGTGKK